MQKIRYQRIIKGKKYIVEAKDMTEADKLFIKLFKNVNRNRTKKNVRPRDRK